MLFHSHVANMQIKKLNSPNTLEAPLMPASSHYPFKVKCHLVL